MDFKGIGGYYIALIAVVIIGVAIAGSKAFKDTIEKATSAIKGK